MGQNNSAQVADSGRSRADAVICNRMGHESEREFGVKELQDAVFVCLTGDAMHVSKWRFRDRWLYVYLMVLVTQDFIAIQHGDKVN